MIHYVDPDGKHIEIKSLTDFRIITFNENTPENFDSLIKSDIKILWKVGTPVRADYGEVYDDYINHLRKIEVGYDIIVFDDSRESNYKKDIIKLHNRLRSKVIYIHGSADPMYDLDYMIENPGFLQCEPYIDLPFKKRNPLFSCLSRMLMNRQQRMMITLEIYKRGLLDYGVVSCGSGESSEELVKYSQPQKFPNEIYEKYKSFFQSLPIIADVKNVGSNFSNSANHLNNPGKDCLFNVVIESSGENKISKKYPGVYFNKGWDNWFITEKTMKFINCRQIPIFLSTQGYVGFLRDLGFDVFDDFVNHSYDTEENQDLRIEMIVDELERLIKDESVYNILKNEQTIRIRMDKNISVLQNLISKKWENYYEKLYSQLSKSIDKPNSPTKYII